MKSKSFAYAAAVLLAAIVFLIASLMFHDNVDIVILLTAILTPVGIGFAATALIISTSKKVEV